MSTAQGLPSSRRTVFKGAFQGTAFYSIPLIAQRIASICLLSIVTRVLTRADFGMLSLLEQVSAVVSTLLCGSFSSSLGYFYFQKNLEEKRSQVVGTAIWGSFLVGSMAALICWPARGMLARYVFRSQDALLYLPLVFLFLPFNFGLEALLGWLRVEDRQMAYVKIGLLRIGLTVAGIGVLVGVFKMHVMGYLSTTVATYVLTWVCLVLYLFRKLRPSFSFRLFAGMLRFSMPLGLSMLAMFVINFGDQFVLRQYRSLGEVGIYSLGYRIGMIVGSVYISFHAYWSAQVYRILQMEDAEEVFARLLTYTVLLLSSFTLLVTVCSRPGLHVLVKPAFWEAAPLVPAIVVAYGIRHISDFLRCRFWAAGQPSYETACIWASGAVCVALYFLLIPRFGMWGGAISTIATCLVLLAISAVWTYRMNPYRVEGGRLLKLGSVLVVIAVLYYAVPVASLALDIAWSALLLALFPAGLWLLRFPTPGEWQAARSAVQRIANWRLGAASA